VFQCEGKRIEERVDFSSLSFRFDASPHFLGLSRYSVQLTYDSVKDRERLFKHLRQIVEIQVEILRSDRPTPLSHSYGVEQVFDSTRRRLKPAANLLGIAE